MYINNAHTMRLLDLPQFPQEYRAIASAQAEVLDFLRTQKTLHWVYVSPPALFIPHVPREGRYQIIGEEFRLNANKESKISYADYAIAIIDIACNPLYNKQRIGIMGV